MKDLRIKILVGLVAGLILVGFGWTNAYAYSFGVSLNHNSWDLGMKGGGIATENTSYFYATSTGGSLEGLKISATSDKGWTIGDTAALDVFVLEHKPTSGGSYVKVASDGNTYLKEELAPSASHSFDLKFTTPTSTTQTEEHTITNTITAAGPSGYTYNSSSDFYYKYLGIGAYSSSDWSGSFDHVITGGSGSLTCSDPETWSIETTTPTRSITCNYGTQWVWLYPFEISTYAYLPGGTDSYWQTYATMAYRTNLSSTAKVNINYEKNYYGTRTGNSQLYTKYVVLD